MSDSRSCPSREALVTALYDEATAAERLGLEAHLRDCARCRDEMEGLGALRLSLQEWQAPASPDHFRVVADPAEAGAAGEVVPGPARWWSRRALATAAMAAAASLVLGMSAGLANLEVTVGQDGVTFRTGWARQRAAAPGGSGDAVAAGSGRPAGAEVVATAPAAEPVAAGTAKSGDWEREVAAAEQRILAAVDQRLARTAGPVAAAVPARLGEEAFMQRVQELLDASETRQQRNLALRITELARDFDLQRKSDLVTIQQGLGQLEGRTQAEAARTRELVNYIARVSAAVPQR